jgi:putative transposase
VFFFIELGARRIHFAGCAEKPSAIWVSQQARQLIWELDDSSQSFRYLIPDHETKFSSMFASVFFSENIDIIHTPFSSSKSQFFCGTLGTFSARRMS